MTDILNVNTGGLFYVSTWIIDPFASALRQHESNHSFQSPVLQTRWNDNWQITLKFTRKSPSPQQPSQSNSIHSTESISYDLSTTLVRLINTFPLKGKPTVSICVVIPKSLNAGRQVFHLHKGFALNSTLHIDHSAVWLRCKKLELSIEFDFYDGLSSTIFNNNERFTTLKEAKGLHDVTILVDGQELKANKTVLALTSPVFFAMFTHEFKEKLEQRICIEDTDVHTMEKFLDFAYTGQNPVFIDVASAIKLFYLAEKYQVFLLKQICLQYLRASTADEKGFVEMLLSFPTENK